MRLVHVAALGLLGAIWGASFLFIGLAASEFGPFVLMFLRVAVAGLALTLLAALTTPRPEGLLERRNLPKYLVLGLLNCAIPFSLIAFSELTLPVSLAAILNSTTPLFTALIAAWWGNEALSGRKILGVLLGLVGVAILVGGGPLQLDTRVMIAVLASLLGALSYGAATVYAAKHVRGLPPIYASIVQLSSAALWLALPAALSVPAAPPSVRATSALLALALLASAFAYLLYFFLLQNVGPTRTSGVTFLVPVFGSFWGVAFVHETFSYGMLLGIGVIFASLGLVMVSGRGPVPAEIKDASLKGEVSE